MLSWSEKIAYLIYLSHYAIERSERQILYLGRLFRFDNPKMPFILLGYPQGVGVDLVTNLSGSIRGVLDIGGNIGQFATTLLYFLPELRRLDVFEPNPTVFPVLSENLAGRAGVTLHRVGVGYAGKRRLFYVPDASATGSFTPNRAQHLCSETSHMVEVEVEVEITGDVAGRTGEDSYDLVKIDVEGAEFEVLEVLNVRTRYFWLELSGRKFGGHTYHTSQLFELIRRRFGEFDVLFQSRWDSGLTSDILLELVHPLP